MLKRSIQKLIRRENLSVVEIQDTLQEILETDNEAQVAAFMSLLRAKGETADEIYGIVDKMRSQMIKVQTHCPVLDIVGTGGDGFNTVNISTGSALLAASCGVKIAKHGNRSVSSSCGSADVLEALGVNITLDKTEISKNIDQYNFGFCFAPSFHPALAKLKEIRKNLSVPSAFNLVGPLLNPTQPAYLMVGVASKAIMEIFSDVLLKSNMKRALIFHCEGLDELCCVGDIDIIEINDGATQSYTLDPTSLGFSKCSIKDLQGGTVATNATLLLDVLKGKSNPIADTLILNAGFANYLYGICDSVEAGILLAKIKHREGSAFGLIKKLTKKNKLDAILSVKLQEVENLKISQHIKSLKKALSKPGLSIISEIKRKSPSKGTLRSISDPIALTNEYIKGGASAISVLTDQKYFSGTVEDLALIADRLKHKSAPILRKDFIIDKSQIIESLLCGADAILLIVSALQEKIKALIETAKALGLEVLVEVYDKDELKLALDCGAEIIAVNNRNLKTFDVDINVSLDLIKHIPAHIVKVAASGIHTMDDIKKIKHAGYDAVLIGEALMKSRDPAALITEMRSVT